MVGGEEVEKEWDKIWVPIGIIAPPPRWMGGCGERVGQDTAPPPGWMSYTYIFSKEISIFQKLSTVDFYPDPYKTDPNHCPSCQ